MTGTNIIYGDDKTSLKKCDVVTYASDKDKIGTDRSYKHEIIWEHVFGFLTLHILAVYGMLLLFMGTYKFYTLIWVLIVYFTTGESVTVGAHRCYAHRTFKAKPLLRALMIILFTATGQFSIYTWCRAHRLHHRFSDTDADPHNAQRGFFYSHIGWLLTKRHPTSQKYKKQVDMSDMEADWMVMFQKKYYLPLYIVVGVLIPVGVPVYYFGETWKNSFLLCYCFRYAVQLNFTWFVNSVAHLYGTRPYDAMIKPAESWIVSFITYGEGWHNYHHVFPWDYKAAELSMHFNFSASLIRFFESIGLAYDLKSASPEMVENRIFGLGDGTHYRFSADEAVGSATAVSSDHPFNLSHTTARKNPEPILNSEGLPLIIIDEDILQTNNLKEFRTV